MGAVIPPGGNPCQAIHRILLQGFIIGWITIHIDKLYVIRLFDQKGNGSTFLVEEYAVASFSFIDKLDSVLLQIIAEFDRLTRFIEFNLSELQEAGLLNEALGGIDIGKSGQLYQKAVVSQLLD